jgi:hypothetical protein
MFIDRQGKVLSVREENTDRLLEYTVQIVSEDKIFLYDMESKIRYVEPEIKFISPLSFGEVLSESKCIYVVGNERKIRFPSSCAYSFFRDRIPMTVSSSIPMNFDYASVYHMVQIDIGDAKVEDLIDLIRQEKVANRGYGHPGISTDKEFLDTLKEESCTVIKDDVLQVPFYEGWRPKRTDASRNGSNNVTARKLIDTDLWSPVLREDGNAGLFVGNNKDYYLIISNALPFFVCDQIRLIFSRNTKRWTWKQWANSTEIKRASELSEIAAEFICGRILHEMKALGVKRGSKTVTSVFNVMSQDTSNEDIDTVEYDSGIIRSGSWGAQGALLRIGEKFQKFAWMRNQLQGSWFQSVGGKRVPVLLPTQLDDEDELMRLRKKLERKNITGLHLRVSILKNVES